MIQHFREDTTLESTSFSHHNDSSAKTVSHNQRFII